MKRIEILVFVIFNFTFSIFNCFTCLYAQTWLKVSGGGYHTIAIKSDGTLWAWGYNGYGELGLGYTTQRTTPTQVGTASNWSSVSCGVFHTIAIKTDGTLWAWGDNEYGQLGLGDTTDRWTPTQVGTASNWSSVSGGEYHTIAIKTDGTLWAWGYNNYGQLGLGDTTNRTTPIQVGTLTNWSSVSCGDYHTIAIKTDGTLWTWGWNYSGQLGLGDTTNRTTPTQVGTASNWSSVSGGEYHTIAIKTDGTLWAWGGNGNGQLGLGDTTDRNTPTPVGTLTNWSSVSCGWDHTIAIKSDGTLWAWGGNDWGQLGLGDTTNRTTPTQVGTASNWSSVSGGEYHTIAIKTDGTLWAWGRNDNGQLGLGDTTNRSTPTCVNTPPTLSWTGETNYVSDGLDPETGTTSTNFTYRVTYTDADNDPPFSGTPKVHILKGATEITGSPFTMTYVSGANNTGAIYTYSSGGQAHPYTQGTDYTYYFEAQDITGASATGTPTSSIDAPDVSAPASNLPDLIVYNNEISMPQTSVQAGGNVTISFGIKNTNSNANITNSFVVGYYLSTHNTSTGIIHTGDIEIRKDTIDSSSTGFDAVNTGPPGYRLDNMPLQIPSNITNGYYYVRVIVDIDDNILESNKENNSTYSAPISIYGGVTPENPLENAHCYPVPAMLSQPGSVINFQQFTSNTSVKILSPAGSVLKELSADANGYIQPWDGITDSGEKVASGTYTVIATDDSGGKKIFKIMVVR
ncbi:MAG: hypothetical protein AB1349_05935 [Elusimicrobiota bacterium]